MPIDDFIFTTFLTSRISCNKIYTILIDVSLVKIDQNQILIAVFKTPESTLPGTIEHYEYFLS